MMNPRKPGLKLSYLILSCCLLLGLLQACTEGPVPGADLKQRLARVEAELQSLEDQRDIEVLQRTYGYYVDKNLWSQIADLFTENGSLEIGGRGVFVGRERVEEYLQWLGEPVQGRLYDHTQMQPVITLGEGGESAKGRWRALVFGGDEGGASVFGDVIYENEYRKVEGVWHISKLHAYFIMYTTLDQGWGKFAWPNTRPEEELPPDLPPTVVYDMYPGELTAPYHYDNPVIHAADVTEGNTENTVTSPTTSPEELLNTMAELRQRTDAVAAMQEIEQLQNLYGYYLDAGQWDDVAELFAEEGSIEHGLQGVYRGRERVRESLNLYGEPGLHQGQVNLNMIYQPVIHVSEDGNSANARIRMFSMKGEYEGDATMEGGVFENEYIREDGKWKILSDHLYTTFIADYDLGWSEGAKPAPGMSQELPPDEPPSVEYQAFPTYYPLPFHYNNPVTGADPYKPE